MSKNDNPSCTGCRSSEARCAWLNGQCCARCSHWPHLDADGNDKPNVVVLVACGTQQGYERHRHRRVTACDRCKAAHSVYELQRKAIRREAAS